MHRCKLFILICSTYLNISGAYAQVDELEDGAMDINSENEFVQEWKELLNTKMNIEMLLENEELANTLLTKQKQLALHKHLKNTGGLIDLLELQTIPEISYQDYKILLEYIYNAAINHPNRKQSVSVSQRLQYIQRKDNLYSYQPFSSYQRIKINNGKGLLIGLCREIDQGERFNKSIKRYDHHAYFIEYRNQHNRIILGNFQQYHGQGLMMAQGFSRNSIQSSRINLNVESYTTGMAQNNENNYLNGVYIEHNKAGIKIGGYYSFRKKDEHNTGLHRTSSEISDKRSLKEQSIGMNIHYRNRTYSNNMALNYRNAKLYLSNSTIVNYRNQTHFIELASNFEGIGIQYGLLYILSKKSNIQYSVLGLTDKYHSDWTERNSSAKEGLIQFKVNYIYQYNKRDYLKVLQMLGIEKKQELMVNIQQYSQSEILYKKYLKFNSNILLRARIRSGWKEQIKEENKYQAWVQYGLNLTEEISIYNNIGLTYIKGISSYQQIRIEINKKPIGIYGSVAYFNLSNKQAIYFSDHNVVMPTVQMAVYRNGMIHTLGIKFSLYKSIRWKISVQKNNLENNTGLAHKVMLSVQFP